MTDPNDSDSDDDGLTDQDEVDLYSTDPNSQDSDNDGLSDGEEVDLTTDPNNQDSDNDGLNDGEEVNTTMTDPNDSDSDDDTLSDGEETTTYQTDPNKEDTDGDSYSDPIEIAAGSDPNDPNSIPSNEYDSNLGDSNDELGDVGNDKEGNDLGACATSQGGGLHAWFWGLLVILGLRKNRRKR